jgi:propanol-preferring alcohol dehydrogenase
MAVPSTQIAAAIPPPGPNGSLNIQISQTHAVPKPGDGEVLVKLEFSGVCHSDVHSIRGDTPMLTDVAGHEGVGKVVVGEGSQRLVSDSTSTVCKKLISITHID